MIIKDSGIVHDKNGNEYEACSYGYKGTAIVITSAKWDAPICSCVVTDEGDVRALWIDPEFRGNSDLQMLGFKALQEAYRRGILSVTSGYITGYIHNDNVKSIGAGTKLGAKKNLDKENPKWTTIYWKIEDFMKL